VAAMAAEQINERTLDSLRLLSSLVFFLPMADLK
jgi:hypothetical protein